MENQDKLYNLFKSAAENADATEFPTMENVWRRMEQKLDNKIQKKETSLWKKIAVAASILLFFVIGSQFFKKETINTPNQEIITHSDSEIKETKQENKQEELNPNIEKNAEIILQKQINSKEEVAFEDVKSKNQSNENDAIEMSENDLNKDKINYSQTQSPVIEKRNEEPAARDNDVEMFINRNNNQSSSKKEKPLVVVDDKVDKKSIDSIELNDGDSLVYLKEPLYIINGTEYTEQEVFGPNPTSPYSPLNEQDIETISILQEEKATEIYGKKGEKGVVIVTTKNGKPKPKK